MRGGDSGQFRPWWSGIPTCPRSTCSSRKPAGPIVSRRRSVARVAMASLRELQASITDALLGGDARAAAASVDGDGLAPDVRLDIYRHHVMTTLTAALEATFPVVCRLVDRRFFAY